MLSDSCIYHWETGKVRRAMKQSQKNCLNNTLLLPASDRKASLDRCAFLLIKQEGVIFILVFRVRCRGTWIAGSKLLKYIYSPHSHNNIMKGEAMKRLFLLIVMLFIMMVPALGLAAEQSSDKMILEWNTNKVWISGEDLCVTGTFVNKRNDVTITKLNDFVIRLTYEKVDGTQAQFIGRPVKLPICKIGAGKSKKLNFNFGKFNEQAVNNWVTAQDYVFTYINGARF